MRKVRRSINIDLAAYADEHLVYEAQMFVATREALSKGIPDQFLKNAIIESAGLHFRNLFDFFYPRQIKDDDVIAADYVPNWQSVCPQPTASLQGAHTRTHKEFAHLTTKRFSGTPTAKAWDFETISNDLKPIVRAFVENVDAAKPPALAVEWLRRI
jgi:hypothetical protein